MLRNLKGFHPVLTQGQASSEVFRIMEEEKLLTGQKDGLALCFLFCLVFSFDVLF